MTDIICVFAAAYIGAAFGTLASIIYWGYKLREMLVPDKIINIWHED